MVEPSATEVTAAALAYLAAHRVLTLATTGAEGVWAAAVFYVNDRFDLYFLSAAHTRHASNLAASPRAAGAIHEDYADWAAIKGIQLEGPVERLSGAARQAAIKLYGARFPFLRQAPPPIQAALARVDWYHLRPDRLYFIDNSRGFGHRDEIDLSQDRPA